MKHQKQSRNDYLLEYLGRQLDECSKGNGGCDSCLVRCRCLALWDHGVVRLSMEGNIGIRRFKIYAYQFLELQNGKSRLPVKEPTNNTKDYAGRYRIK